jgi:hypothetical protein
MIAWLEPTIPDVQPSRIIAGWKEKQRRLMLKDERSAAPLKKQQHLASSFFFSRSILSLSSILF